MSKLIAKMAFALAAAMVVAAPAAAQFSQGYKFLEAIRKKEANTAQEMLDVPGTTVVNTRDVTSGDTALHIVTTRRDLPWMQFLLGKGANASARNNRGTTPLQIAVGAGFTEGVELLIQQRARIDEPDAAGETALIAAVHRRDTAIMRLLLKAGANPDRADNSGRTARDYAGLEGRGNPLLAEIENNAKAGAKPGTAQAPARAYGPSF